MVGGRVAAGGGGAHQRHIRAAVEVVMRGEGRQADSMDCGPLFTWYFLVERITTITS